MRYMILASLLLAGCAPHAVATNSAGGVVKITGMLNGQAKGMQFADAECKKYGKVARYVGVNEIRGTLRYECVTP
jgi:hypothetical protein